MSFKAMVWVDALPDLESAEAFVLSTMARYVRDEDMVFFGSLTTVARITRYDRRTVQRSVRRLEDKGCLQLWRADRGRTKHYKLTGCERPRFAPLRPDQLDDADDVPDDTNGTLWTTVSTLGTAPGGMRHSAQGVHNHPRHSAQGDAAQRPGTLGTRPHDRERDGYEKERHRRAPVDNSPMVDDTMREAYREDIAARMADYERPDYEPPTIEERREAAVRQRTVDEDTAHLGREALARIRGTATHAKNEGVGR